MKPFLTLSHIPYDQHVRCYLWYSLIGGIGEVVSWVACTGPEDADWDWAHSWEAARWAA